MRCEQTQRDTSEDGVIANSVHQQLLISQSSDNGDEASRSSRAVPKWHVQPFSPRAFTVTSRLWVAGLYFASSTHLLHDSIMFF